MFMCAVGRECENGGGVGGRECQLHEGSDFPLSLVAVPLKGRHSVKSC